VDLNDLWCERWDGEAAGNSDANELHPEMEKHAEACSGGKTETVS
jgi:hypothetical protein